MDDWAKEIVNRFVHSWDETESKIRDLIEIVYRDYGLESGRRFA
jgi:hypothetical protein